jgi:hypothetical protein
MAVGATMARPKKDEKSEPKPRTLGIRASGEWADWLERAAKHDRAKVAAFLDRAAAHYAKAIGFNEAPPERGSD